MVISGQVLYGDALAELGLYPETLLSDIGDVYWPDVETSQ